ncbi:MAG TPA: BTAD domain-containing putative transcriptional regulator [Nocardioidaceae bacterium]|nr:BTAD domain-containing putative transcriptional regulator [Nocardioidaceae bacterium]
MAGGSLEFRVLGPLDVRRGGKPVAPAGARRRCLLAMLLLDAGRVVPVERLIDGIWGNEPPSTAIGLVQTYVSLWRRVLGEGAGPDEPERLLREGHGYRLVVRAQELDLARVRDLSDRGRTALSARDYVRAADLLTDALGQWRGVPLADLAGEPFHRAAIHGLLELRRATLLDWVAALVNCGRGQEAVEPLTTALDADPLQEEVAEALVRTLCHVGRASQGLDVLDRTRTALADALGVDPGERLRNLHLQILRQDPALTAPADSRSDVPLPLASDSFVGREAAMADLAKLLHSHRLVTLTGPGGSGKTRLAVEVAAGERDSFGEAVRFVDASPITEAGDLPARVVGALGARIPGGQTAWQALGSATADLPHLLILDNCEQIVGAANFVTELLALAPQLTLLVTSREPLHAQGEQRYPVWGLALDTRGRELPRDVTEGAAAYPPAVRLFVDRSAAIDPGLTYVGKDLEDIAEICRRLDGLPLAIELAAGWMGLLSPRELLLALNEKMDVLTATDDGRPARQRTLRATMDWSYSLLDGPGQRVFRGLSVFRGGFTARVAATVLDEPLNGLLLVLRGLRDKGLLDLDTRVGSDAERRYRLLTTVREYAQERLVAQNEQSKALSRHADFFVSLAEAEGGELGGPGQTAAADRLSAHYDDITAGLRWMVANADPDRALDVAASLWRFWHLRSHLDEGRRFVQELADIAGPRADPRSRARTDLCLGNLTYWQTRYEQALEYYSLAAGNFRELDDSAGLAEATYDQGFALHLVGRTGEGQARLEEARERYRSLGDAVGEANAVAGLAFGLCSLGRLDEAAELAQISLSVLREHADSFSIANTVGLLGMIRLAQGHLERAEPLLHEALATHAGANHPTGVVWMLRGFATLALARSEPRRALRLAAAADLLDPDQQGGFITGVTEPDVLTEAGRLLPAPEVQRLWEAGHATSIDDAVRDALSDDKPVNSGPTSR